VREIHSGADVAIGSRYVPGGGIEGWTTTRRIISKGATLLARLSLPAVRRVRDPLSGFFATRRQVVEGVELKPIGYKILLEILARGKPAKVREVPYVFKVRERGESKLSFREQIRFLQHIAVLARDSR
jgi:dolichol-phosphate mannosyltransferase